MLSKEFIINLFKQGKTTNCAIVALLKSAIGHLSMNVVNLTDNEDGFTAHLRNNEVINISNVEYFYAIQNSGFVLLNNSKTAKEYFEYLHRIYAIMVKINMNRNGEKRDYATALYKLNYSENTDYIENRIRLENFYSKPLVKGKDLSKEEFDYLVISKKHFLLYNDHHTVYASEGYYDDYGYITYYRDGRYNFKYLKYVKD